MIRVRCRTARAITPRWRGPVLSGQETVNRKEPPVEPEPLGEYLSLVVRVHANNDGEWNLSIDGIDETLVLPLVPATFVIRLWRATATGMLRGTIQHIDTDHSAPIQSNSQLEQLVRAWLTIGGSVVASSPPDDPVIEG
jgi:hypothetical protein